MMTTKISSLIKEFLHFYFIEHGKCLLVPIVIYFFICSIGWYKIISDSTYYISDPIHDLFVWSFFEGMWVILNILFG